MQPSCGLPAIGSSFSFTRATASPGECSSPTFKRLLARRRSHSFDEKSEVDDEDTNTNTSRLESPLSSFCDESSTASSPRVESLLPTLTPSSSGTFSSDKSVTPSSRSSNLMSFVRIFCGLKTFYPRNETVVIAIYYQPTVQLFEVIILDILVKAEICRLYFNKSELILQLRKRRAVAELNNKLQTQQNEASENSILDETEVVATAAATTATSATSTTSFRQQRAEKTKKHNRRRSMQDVAQKDAMRWLRADSIDDIKQDDDEDEVDLDTIDVNSLTGKKVPHSVFSSIILKFIKSHRVSGVVYKYRLVNDITRMKFIVFPTVPEEIPTLAPTSIDPPALITQAKSVVSLRQATSSLRQNVDAADTYTTNMVNELVALDECHALPPKSYNDEGKLNPNVLRWRLLWQSAIRSVIEKGRASNRRRGALTVLVEEVCHAKKEKDEAVEDIVRQNMGGGFRPLRARRKGISVEGGEEGSLPMSSLDMAQYRAEMAARRQLRKDMTARIMKL